MVWNAYTNVDWLITSSCRRRISRATPLTRYSALEIDDFLVAECVPMFADFTQEMFAGHQECTCEKIGGFFFVLFAQAVGVNEAMCKFMG